jgi:hypothetical protein
MSGVRSGRRCARLLGSTSMIVVAVGGFAADPFAPPAAAQVADRILVPSVRIGSMGDPETALSAVPLVAVSDDGRIAVPQPLTREVLIFSSSGKRLATIGRDGEGPGEFRRVSAAGWRRDTLWVVDSSLRRVTLFPPDSADPVVVPSTGVVLSNPDLTVPHPLGDSRWFSTQILRSGADAITGYELVVLDDRWSEPRVLVALQPPATSLVIDYGAMGSSHLGLQPFSDHPLYAFSPDGTSLTVVRRAVTDGQSQDGTALTVTRTSLRGDTIFHVTPAVAVQPIAEDTRRAVIEHHAANPRLQRRLPSVAAVRDALESALHVPRVHPPATGVIVGIDGRTWVRGADDWQGTVRWHVLDGRGRIESVVDVDREIEIWAADHESVWAVLRDDLDVPYVVGYAIEPPLIPER